MASKNLPATTGRTTRGRSPAPAVVQQSDLVISGVPTLAEVRQAIKERVKLSVDDEAVATGSFLDSVLDAAENPEDLFNEGELIKVKEHLGEVFTIQGIDGVRNSDFDEEGSLGIYLVVSAVDSEGELVKMAVGATDPVAKIIALSEMDAFPWRVSFEKSEKATKRGYFPVNLVNRQASSKSGQRVDF